MASEEYRYNAFISYRRTPQDTAVAKEVQHSLEHFRIPADIRKQTGVERIDRIFRDQEELEITPDLSGRIERALASSEFLIVICSPEYSQSPWCLHELRTFIGLRGAEHVLCVLSAGEPPSVFPEELLHRTRQAVSGDGNTVTVEETVEPMACDYRGNVRRARRTELPRLAAAMLRCSYDDLVMRRERYRKRRLTAVISAATVAASAAISYLLWSNAQISKNYRQALISESRLLASESLEAYDNQNRLLALESGLQALVGSDPNRPVTDEALFSLSQATYSYTTPYNMLETWRIDLNHDITDWFVSRDGQYLVCMDRTGEFSCYEMNSRKLLSRFKIAGAAVPSAPVEGTGRDFFCYAGGEVFSADYLTGSINWREAMYYGTLGSVQLSPDGRFLAAADSYAVWVMTTDDIPYAGLRLPESENAFITGLCWSPDGSLIALKLKESETRRESVGVFVLETGAYTRLDCNYEKLDLFRFDEDNTLFVLGDDRYGYSTDYDGVTTLIAIPYNLRAYQNGKLLWQHDIAEQTLAEASDLQVLRTDSGPAEADGASGEEGTDKSPDSQKQLYFSLGSKVYVLDENGTLLTFLETHRDIIRLLNITQDTIAFVTSNGDRGTGWPGLGGSMMTKTFPSGLERIDVLAGRKNDSERFAALSSGDLYIYESVSDRNISLIGEDGFRYYPDGLLRDGKLALLLSNGTVYTYDLKEHRQLAVTALPEGDAWHLLTALDGKAYLLRIHGDEGDHSVLCMDMATGEMTGETALPTSDYLTRTGIQQTPFTREDALYTSFLYNTPSAAAVNGEYLYLHDDRSDAVFRLHLPDGILSELQFSLPEELAGFRLISNESGYPLASPLVISPNGEYLFTVATDPDDGKCCALLIDLGDYTVTLLPGEPQDLSSVAFESASGQIDAVLYSGSHELYISSTDGRQLASIPWTGDKPLSFSVHDGKLYCVFRDSSLRVYQDGKQIRSIPLTFTLEQDVVSGRDFRYEFQGRKLFLYCGADLNVISLDAEGTTPLYAASSVLERLENGELILFSWPPESEGLFSEALNSSSELAADRLFYLACIPEYSTEGLIIRAQEQIGMYMPAS